MRCGFRCASVQEQEEQQQREANGGVLLSPEVPALPAPVPAARGPSRPAARTGAVAAIAPQVRADPQRVVILLPAISTQALVEQAAGGALRGSQTSGHGVLHHL